MKAEHVARRFPGHWVLGADTVVALGRLLFGKPRNMREAEVMLAQLSGCTHRVITGVCFHGRGAKPHSFAVTTRVTFKRLSRCRIQSYLKKIRFRDKAGAYAAQSYQDHLIQHMEGSFSNIVGLPMERLILEWKRLCGE